MIEGAEVMEEVLINKLITSPIFIRFKINYAGVNIARNDDDDDDGYGLKCIE